MSDNFYFMLLLVLMVLSLGAQNKVARAFNRYNGIRASCGMTGEEVARDLLQSIGSDVQLTRVSGSLTDHYDPLKGTVGLSTDVCSSYGIAAIAVAAHEIGHVQQYQEGYRPIRVRNAILPAANIASTAAPWIVLLGAFMGSYRLAMLGAVLFGAMLLFQLITLPVELDASNRALAMLEQGGYIAGEEQNGAKTVLKAAAMTYVYAALSVLINFLRLLNIARSARRER